MGQLLASAFTDASVMRLLPGRNAAIVKLATRFKWDLQADLSARFLLIKCMESGQNLVRSEKSIALLQIFVKLADFCNWLLSCDWLIKYCNLKFRK